MEGLLGPRSRLASEAENEREQGDGSLPLSLSIFAKRSQWWTAFLGVVSSSKTALVLKDSVRQSCRISVRNPSPTCFTTESDTIFLLTRDKPNQDKKLENRAPSFSQLSNGFFGRTVLFFWMCLRVYQDSACKILWALPHHHKRPTPRIVGECKNSTSFSRTVEIWSRL